MMHSEISRRKFLKSALALSAASVIPSFWIPAKASTMPKNPFVSANDRVNIAFIGIEIDFVRRSMLSSERLFF